MQTGVSYNHQTVALDGETFSQCQFAACRLVYSGGIVGKVLGPEGSRRAPPIATGLKMDLHVSAGTDSDQIGGWDSFAHINIIVATEGHFGVRFRSHEARDSRNVGELVRLIMMKRAQTAI